LKTAAARRPANACNHVAPEGAEETTMTEKKKAKSSKKQTAASKPDSLTKSGQKRDVELTEKELARASGGVSSFQWGVGRGIKKV
jgi:hypothetical protein